MELISNIPEKDKIGTNVSLLEDDDNDDNGD